MPPRDIPVPPESISDLVAEAEDLLNSEQIVEIEVDDHSVSSSATFAFEEGGRPPQDQDPVPASLPPRTLPPRTLPPGTLPPGTLPPGTLPPGTLPPRTLSQALSAATVQDAEGPGTPTDEQPLVEIPGYRLIERIGRGGMGEVHLAERLAEAGVSVRCALKLVLPGRRADPVYARQLLTEARIVAQLRHPNIVAVFDAGKVGDAIWLAMEWVDGCDARSLRRMARDRGTEIPLRHVVYIAREALQGLHHAHSARDQHGRPLGIVHRDISPGNLLVSRHGAVKLADFGVAAAQLDSGSRLRLAGKPQYLAPELWRGSPATVQSDIFAMGVTLYELLTMETLFGGTSSIKEVEARVLAFDPRKVLAEDLTLPDGMEPILLRSLAPDPDARYHSALEMLEDVSDFAYEAGLRLLDAHFGHYVERSLDSARPES